MATLEHESAAPNIQIPLLEVRKREESVYDLLADGEKVGEADTSRTGDICYIDYLGPEAELQARHLVDPFSVQLAITIRRDYPETKIVEDYNGRQF
jgi:hypothetical protein